MKRLEVLFFFRETRPSYYILYIWCRSFSRFDSVTGSFHPFICPKNKNGVEMLDAFHISDWVYGLHFANTIRAKPVIIDAQKGKK